MAASADRPIVALAFGPGLTIEAGDTLTLTGSNPVILAVYGAATIAGVIDASAQGGTPGGTQGARGNPAGGATDRGNYQQLEQDRLGRQAGSGRWGGSRGAGSDSSRSRKR